MHALVSRRHRMQAAELFSYKLWGVLHQTLLYLGPLEKAAGIAEELAVNTPPKTTASHCGWRSSPATRPLPI
jgi:hypothetical protein